MRLKPDGRWLRFKGVEDFEVERVAFSWRARFLLLRVVDGYAGGEGRLEVRFLGLVPVLRAEGPDVDEGEALRYLAELPWVPHAMLANRELEWHEFDGRTVEVATTARSRRAGVKLEFDADGDIVGSRTDARPRKEGTEVVRRAWAGTFADYESVNGVRIPTRAEVRWELSAGPFVYWRGAVTSLELDPS